MLDLPLLKNPLNWLVVWSMLGIGWIGFRVIKTHGNIS